MILMLTLNQTLKLIQMLSRREPRTFGKVEQLVRRTFGLEGLRTFELERRTFELEGQHIHLQVRRTFLGVVDRNLAGD